MNYRELVRSEKCIEKKDLDAQQIAQGMAEYAKLDPSAFDVPDFPSPYLSIGLHSYLEFLCPDLFNEAAYKRDEAAINEFSEELLKHPGILPQS